jgi:methylmalonyl-CoA mutase
MTIKQRIEQFVKRKGRRPRILVTTLDEKVHDHDTQRLAARFAEAGFDVDISLRYQTPPAIARMSIENDVHIVCFLSTENQHRCLVSELRKTLDAEHAGHVKMVRAGSIFGSDDNAFNHAGVDLILDSLSADVTALNRILDMFE